MEFLFWWDVFVFDINFLWGSFSVFLFSLLSNHYFSSVECI